MTCLAPVCVSAALFCACGAIAEPLVVRFDWLGVGNGQSSYAHDINNRGDVAGEIRINLIHTHPFLYSEGTMSDLSPLTGDGKFYGINDRGWCAGMNGRPIVYDGSCVTSLGLADGYEWGEARGIDNANEVVGASYKDHDYHATAFLYSGGIRHDFAPDIAGDTLASGINDRSQAVGTQVLNSSVERAFVYDRGDLTLIGAPSGGQSFGTRINDLGQVTGYFTSSGGSRAFFWDGNMRDLGVLPGTTYSEGQDVNNLDQVVGFSESSSGPAVGAFLYTDGAMFDLGVLASRFLSPGFYFEDATGITGNGWVCGYGWHAEASRVEAWRMQVVPEPGAVLLIPLAFGVLALRHKR